MATISDEQRIRYEYLWANKAVKDHLEATDRATFFSLRFTSRTHAHTRKRYVVWQVTEGEVEVLDVLRLKRASLSAEFGIGAVFTRRDGTEIDISSIPSRLPGLDVFVWVPAFADVRWAPEDWDKPGSPRILRVPLSYKQTRAVHGGAVEGVQYFSELGDFTRLNPGHEQAKL